MRLPLSRVVDLFDLFSANQSYWSNVRHSSFDWWNQSVNFADALSAWDEDFSLLGI